MKTRMDTDDFRRAVETYADMVFRIAFQNVQNTADAEDAVQDVFLRLLKAAPFRDEEHLKAWLIRVTVNRCRSHWRTAWVRHTVPLDEACAALPAEDRSLWEELWSLPQKYRNVLYLHYYEGYTAPEIAALLKLPLNTVYTHLRRGKQALKSVILEEEA
jgi:RNA polymerase sigma-70 factor (ECF subfamily)